jgi:hypothetical protein
MEDMRGYMCNEMTIYSWTSLLDFGLIMEDSHFCDLVRI